MNTVILFLLVLSALWTIMTRSLLRCAIGLAVTSVILAVLIYRLNAPLAAVFELSVCAGLISVLFISTISLTQPLTQEQRVQRMRERLGRFWYLPIIIVAVCLILSFITIKTVIPLPPPEAEKDVRTVLWNTRQVDLIGQVIILLTGVFGVVIFFRERRKDAR
jgi:NADH-quinone oxidoreductase subunit J